MAPPPRSKLHDPLTHTLLELNTPDLLVRFTLTANSEKGTVRTVQSGYRPAYKVREDYWTSAYHEFVDTDSVSTGITATANVWLLTPEAYPSCLWEGQQIEVAEDSRIVGAAIVITVLNPVLRRYDRMMPR